MALIQLPGYGYVDDSLTGQRMLPGAGYVVVSGGGSGDTALTVADSAQSQLVDNIALSASGDTALTVADSTQAQSIDAVVLSIGNSLVLEPLKNNTGTLLANETGATAYVYNVITGALVVAKTGQTTNASGIMTITDALIASATEYRVVIVLASGAEGMDRVTS